MCDPLSISMAILSAAGTGAEIDAQNKMAEAEATAAQNAAATDYAQMLEQQYQIQDKKQLDILERTRQGLRERAMLTTAAGEAGVTGNSVMREAVNSEIQESFDTTIVEKNAGNAMNQNRMEMQGIYTNAQSRVNAAQSKVVNPFMAALQIGQAGMGGFSTGYNLYKQMFPKTTTTTT